MASRKPNGQFAKSPPASRVAFYNDSVDEDTSDAIDADKEAAEQKELLEKMRRETAALKKEADGKQFFALKSVDSEVFDTSPFQSAVGGSGPHVVSSPFETPHYPIEIQENKKAIQRQINSRCPHNTSRRWSLQTRMGNNSTSSASSGLANAPPGGSGATAASPGALSPSPSASYPDGLCSATQQTAALSISPHVSGAASPVGGADFSTANQRLGFGATSPTGPSGSSSGFMAAGDAAGRADVQSPQGIEMHTFRDAIDVNYQRMALTGDELSGVPLEDVKEASTQIVKALHMRQEYMERIGNHFPTTTSAFLNGDFPENLPKERRKNTEQSAHTSFNPPAPPEDHWGLKTPLPKYEKTFKLGRAKGVVTVLNEQGQLLPELEPFYISKTKFLKDYERLLLMIADGPLKSFCYRRLSFLQTKFQLHVLLNEVRELHEQKSVPHRDFYNIRKVDNHIHAASSMNQKHLLRFIKKKLKTESDHVVMEKNGQPLTMKQMFDQFNIDAYDLSVDVLDVHADRNTFHRFDKFNTKYNPVGQSVLREVFIKVDNYVNGKYFAELLKEVLSDLEDSKYQHAEPRLSIYGRKQDEWDTLAKWALNNDVWSPNVRWMIQIPRLYDVYKERKMIANFDEFLANVFTPLFEATNDPDSHPELARFLANITGIDSVDDESKHEYVHFDKSTPYPEEYTDGENPPYSYYIFFMYANLTALNAFRRLRGLNTFALRPHCGEAGHINHLVVAYLTSESISHGLLLRKVPVLQYLFYLTQMGIAMSPLSNNSLFISYHRNPLPEYLMKGLNVSISTDDPLQFHFTKEALMEEFSIAAQVWKLSSCDMCELARNSVLQSGFEEKVKIHWLGPNYKEEGVLGNDVARTNVPDIRVSFRHEALVDELVNLFKAAHVKI
ncbi:AMP deaminase [Aphelenchoides fujianensis]|nr:AMP deaminase [Aphelenchoides fujianensis]